MLLDLIGHYTQLKRFDREHRPEKWPTTIETKKYTRPYTP